MMNRVRICNVYMARGSWQGSKLKIFKNTDDTPIRKNGIFWKQNHKTGDDIKCYILLQYTRTENKNFTTQEKIDSRIWQQNAQEKIYKISKKVKRYTMTIQTFRKIYAVIPWKHDIITRNKSTVKQNTILEELKFLFAKSSKFWGQTMWRRNAGKTSRQKSYEEAIIKILYLYKNTHNIRKTAENRNSNTEKWTFENWIPPMGIKNLPL